jgi:hypothetical protein
MNRSARDSARAAVGHAIAGGQCDPSVAVRSSPGRISRVAALALLTVASCAPGVTPGGADARRTTDAAPGDLSSRLELCGGGSDATFAYVATGGLAAPFSAFYGAYGNAFLVIDGGCRYWAGGNPYLRGIRTGVLTPDRAAGIVRDLRLAELTLIAEDTGIGCPDGGPSYLVAGGQRAACGCACKMPANTAVYEKAYVLQQQLLAEGEAAQLPIRVIATTERDSLREPLPWPLSWSPREVLVGPDEPGSFSGRLVTDSAELAALRALRAQIDRYASQFTVRTADGQRFDVLPRDEAPPAVEAILAPLLVPFRR